MNLKDKINSIKGSKFIIDSSWTIVSHLIVGISGLLINTLVGIHYNVKGLGVLNQSLSIYLILTVFANFGIQSSIHKYTSQYSENDEEIKRIFSSAILTTFIASLITTFIFYLVTVNFSFVYKSDEVKELTNILLFAVPLFSLNKTMNNFLAGKRSMKKYSLIRMSRWIFVICFILFFIFTSRDLNLIGFAFILTELLLLVYFVIILKPYYSSFTLLWVKKHCSFGSQSILIDVVASFNTRIPILLIGYSLSDSLAGYYSYIETFVFSVMLISGALQKNFNTVYTKLWYAKKNNEINKKITKVFKVSSIISLPLFIGAFAFYFFYTKLFMQQEYLNYSLETFSLLISIWITFILVPFSTLLIMSGYLKLNILRVAIILFINIFFISLLLKPFGLYGVAISLFFSSLIDLFLLQVFYVKKLNINIINKTFLSILK